MDDTLGLHPLASTLPLDRPFTRGTARAAGVERPALERMLRTGSLRRLLRGVYAATGAPDSVEFRAAAVGLAVERDVVGMDRTAAWVHGVDLRVCGVEGLVPLDLAPGVHDRHHRRSGRQLVPRDLCTLEGICLTTPLRTALDVGRLFSPDRALAALDQLLAVGGFTHTQLLAELPRMAGCQGVGQLRSLAARADARSGSLAESVLRHRWLEAELPTPTPGLRTVAGHGLVRLCLATPERQFAVALAGQLSADELVALEGAGWRVVVLGEERVLQADPEVLIRHLEREFHQQLLAQVG